MNPTLEHDLMQAVEAASFPDVMWTNQDDLCDCTYQRIGFWTNPYIAETLEIRLCCFWEFWYREHPEFIRKVPAYRDQNAKTWVPDAHKWNADFPMPAAIWYRQLAHEQERPLADIRAEYSERLAEKPRGVIRQPKKKKHWWQR